MLSASICEHAVAGDVTDARLQPSGRTQDDEIPGGPAVLGVERARSKVGLGVYADVVKCLQPGSVRKRG